MDWQRGKLSLVDINQAPIPLAFAIIDANRPLYSRDEGRRLREEARIMSRMGLDYSLRTATGPEPMSDNAYISALRSSLSWLLHWPDNSYLCLNLCR